ncbi:MAG TPA: tyrosine--tRNA ligase [Patescibacteria group bacterium]|nr:tyrosine--tRNA ligase [Patescibacteria group bacterium]
MNVKAVNDILAHFERTTDQFFSKDELRAKLVDGKKLRIKYGVDVTAPTLHIGHAVNMWLMRYLQDRGHKVIFLIGDFTTRIGDPSGKSDTRPVIPREEIENNARLFIDQARMVLRFDDPNLLEIRRNSEWLDKLSAQELLNLLAMVTHARLISRDMFRDRIEHHRDIHMHEMIYPVLQGYDSVAIEADMTIIGSDQLFNEMMGRTLQEKFGQKPQTIVTTQITPGIDGKAKQSKSLGNYIGLAHSPRDKFGRTMSIPDNLIEDYFRIYTDLPATELAEIKPLIKTKPRDAKIRLANAIVARYHGDQVAAWETEWFENTVSKGNMPADIPTLAVMEAEMTALELVALTRLGKSKSDTRRLIEQGGAELNGDRLRASDEKLYLSTGDILKVGKRSWYRIEVVRAKSLITEHLRLDPLQLGDLDLMTAYLPSWEIVKYLTKPLSAWVSGGGKPIEMKSIAPPGEASKVAASVAREVFRKVISKPEPKDEWLWKISKHAEPEQPIGIAHLRRDFEHGNQNVWLAPQAQDPALAQEAMTAINQHAFTDLGFSTMVFKEAFTHATRDETDLKAAMMKMEPAARPIDPAATTFGITKEAFQQAHPPLAQPAPPPAAALAPPVSGAPPVGGQPGTALPGMPGMIPGMPPLGQLPIAPGVMPPLPGAAPLPGMPPVAGAMAANPAGIQAAAPATPPVSTGVQHLQFPHMQGPPQRHPLAPALPFPPSPLASPPPAAPVQLRRPDPEPPKPKPSTGKK